MKKLKYIFSLYSKAISSIIQQFMWVNEILKIRTDLEEINMFLNDPKDKILFHKKLTYMQVNNIKKDTLFVNGILITIEM